MEKNPEDYTPNGMCKFTVVKDGHGQEHKVVNFDNKEMIQFEGLVIIEAIKKSTRHQPSANWRAWRDPITDIWWGIPAGLHPKTKNIRWSPIEINDIRTFDLADRQDRQEWAVLSQATFLVGSPNQKYKPTHKVLDKEKDAQDRIKKVSARTEANEIVKNLSELQVIDMARIVGNIDTKQSSPLIIRADLMEWADRNPIEFNKAWFAGNRAVLVVFKRCEATGLIHFDPTAGYVWKRTTPLGTSEPSAVAYVAKNHALLAAMDNESKSKDTAFASKATDKEREDAFIPVSSENRNVDDGILKEMKDQMARFSAKEAELDELLKKAKSAPVINIEKERLDVIVEKADDPTPKETDVLKKAPAEDPELKLLQKKAFDMGMKHAYLPTQTKEKINAWIMEHNKQNA